MQGTQYAPRESILCMEHFVALHSFKCVDKPRDIIIASTFGNTMLDYLSLNITFFILHSIRITSCILVYDLYYRWLTGNGCVS